MLASCGVDQSIRIWEETSVELIIEEEQKKYLKENFDQSETTLLNSVQNDFDLFKNVNPSKSTLKNKFLISSINVKNSGEKICLALDMITWELKRKMNYLKKKKHPDKFKENFEFLKKKPIEYLLCILRDSEGIHLEEVLMVLSFDYAVQLLSYLEELLDNHSNDLELILRCLFFIIREHQVKITTSNDIKPLLVRLRTKTRNIVKSYRDKIGFNLSGLHLIQNKLNYSSVL